MKQLFLLLALLLPLSAVADHERHREHRRDDHRYHERSKFGWGEFVGGVIIGGVIVHEIEKQQANRNRDQNYRRVLVCDDYILRDRWGDPIFDERGYVVKQRRCQQEWVLVRE